MSERIRIPDKEPGAKIQNQLFRIRKTDMSQSINSHANRVLFLQRTIGNKAMQRLIKSGALNFKLRIGQPGNRYEQDADRVAEKVMRMPEPQVSKGKCIQPSEMSTHNSIIQGGQPLEDPIRIFMKSRFGHDFNHVHVHTDARAAKAAQSVHARAFILGNDVLFSEGQDAPGMASGRKLLAHELTHVVQQGINSPNTLQRKPFPGETSEQEIRRKAAIRDTRNAIANIEGGLRAGYLWPDEKMSGSQIENIAADTTETLTERNKRLITLTDDLWGMITELEGGPIPGDWLEPKIEYPTTTSIAIDDDVRMFYGHRMHSRGMSDDIFYLNWMYMMRKPVPTRVIPGTREERTLQTGIWLDIKDPENLPQKWQYLSGFDKTHGYIVELSWDRRGYFYYWRGRKIYLPDYKD